MAKKLLATLVALSLSVTMLAGCGNDSSSNSEKETTTTTTASGDNSSTPDNNGGDTQLKAPVSDTAIDVKDGPTENMIIRSVAREGDRSRLAAKLQYALDNKREIMTVCYLGDSITAGSSASSSNQYTYQFSRWFEDNVTYMSNPVNAGIGATDTYLAVHRAERDVLANNPDIIFIEFINDVDNEFYKTALDSLVRKCLSAENNPAVILVEMTMEDGTSPWNAHMEVAEHYDLPVISYKDAVLPEIEAGNFKWTDISPDNIHPNDAGHKMLGQLLISYVNSVKEDLDNIDKTVKTELPEALTSDKYANATLANRNSESVTVTDEGAFTGTPSFYQNFTDGWGTTTGGTFTFEVEARNIGMVYNKNVDGTYGMAKITVDGQEVKTINADFTGGWGSYACMEEFYTSDETAKHTVTIEIADTGKTNFDIYSLLIS